MNLQTFIGEVASIVDRTDDVHSVVAEGDKPTVGIHVYGADIGAIERRLDNPATGGVRRFVSDWRTPPTEPSR